jgi:hypothetical protein
VRDGDIAFLSMKGIRGRPASLVASPSFPRRFQRAMRSSTADSLAVVFAAFDIGPIVAAPKRVANICETVPCLGKNELLARSHPDMKSTGFADPKTCNEDKNSQGSASATLHPEMRRTGCDGHLWLA